MNWVREMWLEERPELRSESRFRSMFLGNWEMNDAVHKREDVVAMLQRGEISEARAQEMLRMRYAVNSKEEKVVARQEFR